MRSAGTVHTRPAVSISSHVASRTSPDRAAVSTRNSNASLTARVDLDARTVAIAAATSRWGKRPHVAHDVALRAEDRADAVAGVVGPMLHGDAPLQHGADALAQAAGGVRLPCQIGVRTARTSALLTSETGRLPMPGRA